jgi:probable addiction module antidote protein
VEAKPRRIRIYETENGKRPFEEWVKDLRDLPTVRRIQARRSYDDWVVESLKGDEKAQAEYVQTTIEDNQGFPKAILVALRHVAEARGFKHFAEETNLNRETLYKTLSEDGNPTLESLTKMLDVLGLDISVKPKRAS